MHTLGPFKVQLHYYNHCLSVSLCTSTCAHICVRVCARMLLFVCRSTHWPFWCQQKFAILTQGLPVHTKHYSKVLHYGSSLEEAEPSCSCTFSSSATFWGSGWTVGSLFSKLGNMVEGHWKRTRTEAHTQLSKGGAIALSWKLKLWTGVAQALFNSQPCNFCPHMRPTISYNFAALTYDLWPLDLPPFWIKWKTLKIYLLLGFSYKVHEMFYTWTLDRNGQNVVIRFFLS